MYFSGEEMICFNSILDGNDIFGIRIPHPPFSGTSNYIEQTKVALRQHNIIKENDELTEFGKVPIRLLDFYKKAQSYLFLNELRIGMIDQENLIILNKENNLFSIKCCKKVELYWVLIKQFPFLRGVKGQQPPKNNSMAVSYDAWLTSLEDKPEINQIIFKKYKDRQATAELVYYCEEERIVQYNLLTQYKANKTAMEVRQKIYNLMEL